MRDHAGRHKDERLRFTRKLDSRRYVITAAQNATPVHADFLKTLETYCNHNNAELVVVPIRYRNPTSIWSDKDEGDSWWDDPVLPYLYNQRKKLNENLVLLGDVKTTPTRESPLMGFEAISHGESAILAHPKLQLRTIPTPQGKLPKILTTTGAVTRRNYTDTAAGKKGEFHHTFGAAVVEIRGKTFHLRQLNATNDGSFIDLAHEYTTDSVKLAPPALGLVMGDTHVRFVDPAVVEATFGRGGMVEVLNPEYLVWHDLFDGYARNPHHRENPFIEIAKRRAGWHNMEQEVKDTVAFLRENGAGRKNVIVASNHDDFFNRWIRDTDWRRDPDNAGFYLETAAVMEKSAKMDRFGAGWKDPFTHWVEKLTQGDGNVRCLKPDESFRLGVIECGYHGHRGPNGARGSVKNLARLGVRTITAHGHAPAIEEGHTRVGTSTHLKLEYSEGPSSWLNSHAVVYANSKRSLLNVIFGDWRL